MNLKNAQTIDFYIFLIIAFNLLFFIYFFYKTFQNESYIWSLLCVWPFLMMVFFGTYLINKKTQWSPKQHKLLSRYIITIMLFGVILSIIHNIVPMIMYLMLFSNQFRFLSVNMRNLAQISQTTLIAVRMRRVGRSATYVNFMELCQAILSQNMSDLTQLIIQKNSPNITFVQFLALFYLNQITEDDIVSLNAINRLNYLIMLRPISDNFVQFVSDMSVAFIKNKDNTLYFCQYKPNYQQPLENQNLAKMIKQALKNNKSKWSKRNILSIFNWLSAQLMNQEREDIPLNSETVYKFFRDELQELNERLIVYSSLLKDIDDKMQINYNMNPLNNNLRQFYVLDYNAQINNLISIERNLANNAIYNELGIFGIDNLLHITNEQYNNFWNFMPNSYEKYRPQLQEILNVAQLPKNIPVHTVLDFINNITEYEGRQGGSYNILNIEHDVV